MFLSPWIARFALLLNVTGTFLIGLAFQATSSDLKFVTVTSIASASGAYLPSTLWSICVEDRILAQTNSAGAFRMGTHERCPESARPAAVVVVDHPSLVTLGLILTGIGFVLQLLATLKTAVPVASSLAQPSLSPLPASPPSAPSDADQNIPPADATT